MDNVWTFDFPTEGRVHCQMCYGVPGERGGGHFKDHNGLKKHIKNKHGDLGVTLRFRCRVCGVTFGSDSGAYPTKILKNHIKSHEDETGNPSPVGRPGGGRGRRRELVVCDREDPPLQVDDGRGLVTPIVEVAHGAPALRPRVEQPTSPPTGDPGALIIEPAGGVMEDASTSIHNGITTPEPRLALDEEVLVIGGGDNQESDSLGEELLVDWRGDSPSVRPSLLEEASQVLAEVVELRANIAAEVSLATAIEAAQEGLVAVDPRAASTPRSSQRPQTAN